MNTQVSPVSAAVSAAILLPYQADWIYDPAPVKIMEKSRRIGLSWGESADAALVACSTREAGGMDVWYIGYNQDMAKEFIRDCAAWAKAYNVACGDAVEEVLLDEDKDILTYVIYFASGFRVTALSSRPSNLRGKQGLIIIDEAAFHDDLAGLIKAAMAFLIWGGKVRIISTHNGEDNPFNLLIKECRAGKKPYSVHRVTFREAVAQGLYKSVCKKMGIEWTQEKEDAWVNETYEFYGDDAAEELDVIPSAGSGVYISRLLVERCWQDGVPVIRIERPDSFVENPNRLEDIRQWCVDTLKPLIDNMPGLRSVFGQDFGRSGDLSVMWLLQQHGPDDWRTPFLVELRNIPFDCQQLILFYILDNIPLFFHAKFDSRGNGQSHAEAALQRYGSHRVECVMLSGPWYNEHFPKYKAALESACIKVPKSEDIVADHRRVILVKGQPRMDEKHDKGSDGKQRHGDTAVAGVLVWACTTVEGEPPTGVQVHNVSIRETFKPEKMRFRQTAGGIFKRVA
jgi:phage FluMu gp28-like protein